VVSASVCVHAVYVMYQHSGPGAMNEMKGRGREWHDGVINTLPFHIKIRGSQMCEKARTGMISDLARVQSGHRRACEMELVSLMAGATFRQQGWDAGYMRLLTGLQI
jgi:hypothetical protein